MNSKAVIMQDLHPEKTKKKNLIKEHFVGFKPRYLFYKWWWKDLYYVFWDAKNRFWYGYSDRDWFNWNYEFAERNIELFKQFRDNSHSLMCRYANPTTLEQMMTSMSQEEQYGFLNTLIECLEDMKDDGHTVAQRLYNKNAYDCSVEERKIVMETRKKSIDLFFDTVRTRFDDFWD